MLVNVTPVLARTDPPTRSTESRSGKMPTTSKRRATSRFKRSSPLVERICRQCALGQEIARQVWRFCAVPSSCATTASASWTRREGTARVSGYPCSRPPPQTRAWQCAPGRWQRARTTQSRRADGTRPAGKSARPVDGLSCRERYSLCLSQIAPSTSATHGRSATRLPLSAKKLAWARALRLRHTWRRRSLPASFLRAQADYRPIQRPS